jgi:micrococcal nuclease
MLARIVDRKLLIVVLAAGLGLLAGCTGGPGNPADTTPVTETATPATTLAPGDHSTVTVTVVDIIDGDTVEIQFENGSTETVRLLGVDTPEVNVGVTPAEFEGVPSTDAGRECLRKWGNRAAEYTADQLDGNTVRLVFDDDADRRGSFDRLLAYILVDGDSVNQDLVAEGYARVYDSVFTRSEQFYTTESDAQGSETGLWECREVATTTPRDTGLAVVDIHGDAAGNDNENLNDEYVVFRNDGQKQLDLTGWRVQDEAGHTYRFPTGFTLDPGDEVTLYTGVGENSATALYWGRERAVWNNGGDTAFVYDDSGGLVTEESY